MLGKNLLRKFLVWHCLKIWFLIWHWKSFSSLFDKSSKFCFLYDIFVHFEPKWHLKRLFCPSCGMCVGGNSAHTQHQCEGRSTHAATHTHAPTHNACAHTRNNTHARVHTHTHTRSNTHAHSTHTHTHAAVAHMCACTHTRNSTRTRAHIPYEEQNRLFRCHLDSKWTEVSYRE